MAACSATFLTRDSVLQAVLPTALPTAGLAMALGSLRQLGLVGLGLQGLPHPIMACLPNLQKLDLSRNHLASLPSPLTLLTSLKVPRPTPSSELSAGKEAGKNLMRMGGKGCVLRSLERVPSPRIEAVADLPEQSMSTGLCALWGVEPPAPTPRG